MFRTASRWRLRASILSAAGTLAPLPWSPKHSRAEEDKVFPEAEVRRHNREKDAWISFNGAVYDITRYIPQHPPCSGLDWSKRLAGRRFEDFLGQ
ncbi:CYB2, partial [Symbiodinium necroappetens]